MTIALVTHGIGHSTDGNGFTTGTIDTTGANFLVVSVGLSGNTGTLSDSKSNTWTPLTQQVGVFSDRWVQLFYAKNATVGSGHTFSITGTSNFPTLTIQAFSGVDTSAPFDVENGGGAYSTSIQTGSVTPGSANEVIIAALAYDDSVNSSIDSGFTATDTFPHTFGNTGSQLAYLIQTTATAENPTFSWTNTERAVAAIASFKAAAGSGAAPTWDFDLQDFQPPYPRRERAAPLIRGDEGITRSFVRWLNAGWETQPVQPPHRRPERVAAVLAGDGGVVKPFIMWINAGWEVQSIQPPHPKPERAATWLRGDDGTQRQFSNWINWGWLAQDPQPPHPRPERVAAIMAGDTGTEAPFAPSVPTLSWDFDLQDFQPPHPRKERAAPLIRGDEGTQAKFYQWFNTGWEIQVHQPQHPRPEKSAAWLRGDEGIQSPFVNWINSGWETQAHQPPHSRPERAAAIARGDEGTENVFSAITVTPPAWGWDVFPFQPPHYAPEKRAAFLRGDDGTQHLYIIWFNAGWELQAFQPKHPRSENAASWLKGDDGNEGTFSTIVVTTTAWGWEFVPIICKYIIRPASIMAGDTGTQAPFIPPPAAPAAPSSGAGWVDNW